MSRVKRIHHPIVHEENELVLAQICTTIDLESVRETAFRFRPEKCSELPYVRILDCEMYNNKILKRDI